MWELITRCIGFSLHQQSLTVYISILKVGPWRISPSTLACQRLSTAILEKQWAFLHSFFLSFSCILSSLFLFSTFILFFYAHDCFPCIYFYKACASLGAMATRRGYYISWNWRYRCLSAAVWVLGI